jgi:hypothetical protein
MATVKVYQYSIQYKKNISIFLYILYLLLHKYNILEFSI